MTHSPVYPPPAEIAERRKQLAPGIHDAFQEFSRQVFAAARWTRRPSSSSPSPSPTSRNARTASRATPRPRRKGAGEPELMEAIWVAAEMRAGGAYAHSTLALEAAGHAHGPRAA